MYTAPQNQLAIFLHGFSDQLKIQPMHSSCSRTPMGCVRHITLIHYWLHNSETTCDLATSAPLSRCNRLDLSEKVFDEIRGTQF